MDQHHDDHAHQGPPPKEVSHPVLWTAGLLVSAAAIVGFFVYWWGVGAIHGRDLGPIPLKPKAAPPVDHAALIADRGDVVLAKGELIYANKCASCHGADGSQPTGGHIRNLAKDAFKAPDGGGPYGFFLTLTNGLGAQMPAYKSSLSVEDRYAVTHFVREKIVKVKNAEHYLADDPAPVKAKIPRPTAGGAGAAEVEIAPWEVKPPKGIEALMAHDAAAAEARITALQGWIAGSALSAADRSALAAARPGHLDALAAAARQGAEGEAAGVAVLARILPLRPQSDLADIHRRLAAAPAGVPQ
jgi:mono/diheme cytochrome c family protein